MSPFYMIDYQPETYYEPSEKKRGVNVHPHRGIEPVILVYQGYIAHADSVGHTGVIGPGDVQWMTAGKGILHKEYTIKEKSELKGIKVLRTSVKSNGKDMQQLADMLKNNKIKSHVSEVFALENMQKAHSSLETGRTVGKIIIKP
jgi:redox-sensitive bicupin YhaK (pirin superfamily)